MSNERQRQASTPVVVSKDILKNRQKQKVALCKTIQQKTTTTTTTKIIRRINTYFKRLTHKTDGYQYFYGNLEYSVHGNASVVRSVFLFEKIGAYFYNY